MTTATETVDILQNALAKRQLADALRGSSRATGNLAPNSGKDSAGQEDRRHRGGLGTMSYRPAPGIWTPQKKKDRSEESGIYSYTLDTMDHPIKRYMSKCFFFFGPRGRAKSLSMTFWFYALRSLYDQIYGPEERLCNICSALYHKETFHRPIRIATNYKCDVADIQDPYLVDKLMAYPPWAHDMDVGIDELGAYVPAARAMSATALNIGTWLQQIRKRRINIYMATQFAQDITRNVLRQVDLFLEPETFDDGHNVFLYPYDLWGYYTGDLSYKRWPPRREDSFAAPILQRDTKRVFGLFNTEEIFAPIWSNQRDTMVDEQGYTFDQDAVGDPDSLTGGLSKLGLSERLIKAAQRTGHIKTGEVFGSIKNDPEAKMEGWTHTRDFEATLRAWGWTVDDRKKGYLNHEARPPLG